LTSLGVHDAGVGTILPRLDQVVLGPDHGHRGNLLVRDHELGQSTRLGRGHRVGAGLDTMMIVVIGEVAIDVGAARSVLGGPALGAGHRVGAGLDPMMIVVIAEVAIDVGAARSVLVVAAVAVVVAALAHHGPRAHLTARLVGATQQPGLGGVGDPGAVGIGQP